MNHEPIDAQGLITSRRDRKVKGAIDLSKPAEREAARLFLVDSPGAIREALTSGATVGALYVTESGIDRNGELVELARGFGVEIIGVTDEVLASLADARSPQGVVATASFVDASIHDVAEADLVVVAAGVQDPGNVGTLIRAADGAGAGAAILCGESADLYNPKTVRSTAGSIFHIPVVRDLTCTGASSALADQGFRLVGATHDAEEAYYDFDFSGKVAVIIGNEASGIPDELLNALDARIAIPMARTGSSLNAAVAGSIILFDAGRRRALAETPTDVVARVVSAVNHDLRSPLTTLKGFATTLSRRWDRLDDQLKLEMIGQIEEGTDRLSRSISEVVDVARLELGEIRLNRTEVLIEPIAAKVVEALASDFPAVNIEIVVETEGLGIYADPDRLERAIATLVENAAKHGRGNVSVVIGRRAAMTIIEVIDDGEGLPAAELELVISGDIAGRARRGHPAGTGLALYVVKRIAEIEGGSVEATSEIGIGSHFSLALPSEAPIKSKRSRER